MQVTMRNFKSSNDQRNTITTEHLLLGFGNALGNGKTMLRDIIWQISPLIDFYTGDNKQVSARNGVDGHEGYAKLISEHECAGQFASNDASKY